MIADLIASLDDDLPRSAAMQEKVPAFVTAFDASRMKPLLQEALIGPEGSQYRILKCTPGKALYLPDHNINMQYRLEIQDDTAHQPLTALINARLFRSPAECGAYLSQVLAPLAVRASRRPEMKPFSNPVAMIGSLNMTVSAFPIDGMIPTLVEASDPSRIIHILGETLPEAVSGEFLIDEVQLLPAHYGRFDRCVLRYFVNGVQAGTGAPRDETVYGKVDADGSGSLTLPIISALREKLHEPGLPYRFQIPDALGYFHELHLLLMEALPGKPFFKDLLKTWSGRSHAGGAANPSQAEAGEMEEAIATCALIAATLHGSGINLGRPATLEMQVADLHKSAGVVSYVFPELGAQIKAWIEMAVELSRDFAPLPLRFSHGDFTYTQLIFDGSRGGLVDFDNICQAEPAQDLGHFLAYQRLNILKNQDPEAPFDPIAIERLCNVFLDTYIGASKKWIADEGQLKGRVAIFELISLIRLALHSWEKMKGSRLKQTLALLDERMECQKQISLLLKNKTS